MALTLAPHTHTHTHTHEKSIDLAKWAQVTKSPQLRTISLNPYYWMYSNRGITWKFGEIAESQGPPRHSEWYSVLTRFPTSQMVPVVKKPAPPTPPLPKKETQETWVQKILGWKDSLELEVATCSSILSRRIPWTEEPGGLQPIGSQRVRHDWSKASK